MTSTRLPGKIMRIAAGRTMLEHHIHRLKQSGFPIIIATTLNQEDDVIANYALANKLPCYRGDEHDVLGRFYHCNRMFPADIIVRVTSDCPLIDAELIKRGVKRYIELNNDCSYVSNCFPRTYARGFDFEIFSTSLLNEAYASATSGHDREHVTPYMREHHAESMHNISQVRNNSSLRLTLDTPEDLQLLVHMLEETDAAKSGYEAIEDSLLTHPDWISINAHIEQKKI